MANQPIRTVAEQRVIRVFVSSTFRDMQAERDELVKRIFPQLRSLCEQRGVTWGEVDLRWGITDEQTAEGKVLPICLDEIDRCRPYFIGLLGERYGWVPDEIPRELVELEPWLAEHLDHSITELEILHGVLNNPEMADHGYFYFRDPAYVDTLPPEQQAAFREGPRDEEIERFGREEAKRRAKERRRKLAALKKRIPASGFPVRKNYRDPIELGKLVLRDMTAVIDKLFPEGTQPDPLAREAFEHEAFATSRAGVYIGRQAYFDRLDAHAQGDGPPLVLLGESGSGKSALVANWALRYRAVHPQDLVLMHFIGASPYSADWAAMLRRVMGEFQRRFGIEGQIPDKPDALRAAFANWLHIVAVRGRVVLILDALNQLEDRGGAPDLVWLPPQIPVNVRMILSTLPGRPLDELKKRAWPTLQVEPLEPDERKRLITQYLAQYSKALSPARIERIASAPQTANPLYLRALLEELRVFGIYEELDHRVGHYLAAPTIPALYENVLERYEEDYERDRPGLVRDAMSLLWAARRGLSEPELLELLGSDGERLPGAYWSPLYLAAEQSLVSRAGLLGFFHDYLRQAVRNRYLPTEQQQRQVHRHLAGYFQSQDLGARKLDELPWQLGEAKSWEQLYDLLRDLDFFNAGFEANRSEMMSYWAQVEANSPLRLVTAYRKIIEAPEQHDKYVMSIDHLLGDTGHPREALRLREYREETLRKRGDLINLAGALGNRANILFSMGDPDRAIALYREQERLCRDVTHDIRGLAVCLLNQSNILFVRGDLDAASALCEEVQRIFRRLADREGLVRCIDKQANISMIRAKLDYAMLLYKEEERLCRELGNKSLLAACLHNQAKVQYERRDLDGALALEREASQLCRELGYKPGLVYPLVSQGVILLEVGDVDRALEILKEAESLCLELGDKQQLASTLLEQGNIMVTKGNLDRGLALYREAEHLYREVGDKAGLARSLGSQGHIHKARGDLDGAIILHKEVERVSRETNDKRGLLSSLTNQSNILFARRDLDGLFPVYKEMANVSRELGDKPKLAASLENLANILTVRGDFDGALALHKEAEIIFRELGDKKGLGMCLYNQQEILKAQRKTNDRMKLLREEEDQFRQRGDTQQLADCLHKQAMHLTDQGDLEGAMRLYKEKEQICRKTGYAKGLATSLTNQFILFSRQGQFTEALPLAEEAYRVANSAGMSSLAMLIKPKLDLLRSQMKSRR